MEEQRRSNAQESEPTEVRMRTVGHKDALLAKDAPAGELHPQRRLEGRLAQQLEAPACDTASERTCRQRRWGIWLRMVTGDACHVIVSAERARSLQQRVADARQKSRTLQACRMPWC